MNRNIGFKTFFCFVALLCLALPVQAEEVENAAYWVDAATGAKLDQLDVAAGQEMTVRLMAEIPADGTLKAFSFMVTYDDAVLEIADAVASPNADLAPAYVNSDTAGEVFANGFSVSGVEAKDEAKTVSLVDVTVKPLEKGESYVSVMFTNFGESADKEFKPEIEPLKISAN